jgi:hypothetical protein
MTPLGWSVAAALYVALACVLMCGAVLVAKGIRRVVG